MFLNVELHHVHVHPVLMMQHWAFGSAHMTIQHWDFRSLSPHCSSNVEQFKSPLEFFLKLLSPHDLFSWLVVWHTRCDLKGERLKCPCALMPLSSSDGEGVTLCWVSQHVKWRSVWHLCSGKKDYHLLLVHCSSVHVMASSKSGRQPALLFGAGIEVPPNKTLQGILCLTGDSLPDHMSICIQWTLRRGEED